MKLLIDDRTDGARVLELKLKKSKMIGTRHVCKKTGKIGKVVAYSGASTKNVVILFDNVEDVLDTKHVIRRGVISSFSKLIPSIFGVGYIGIGGYLSTGDGEKHHSLSYRYFKDMLRRCYGETGRIYPPATVCKEWHNFQNFSEWFYSQTNEHEITPRACLDKDLLGNGERVYSPETCCILPVELNSLGSLDVNLLDTSNCINKDSKGYFVRLSPFRNKTTKRVRVNSEEEALLTVIEFKANKLTSLADGYKEYLSVKAYDALKTYGERAREVIETRKLVV